MAKSNYEKASKTVDIHLAARGAGTNSPPSGSVAASARPHLRRLDTIDIQGLPAAIASLVTAQILQVRAEVIAFEQQTGDALARGAAEHASLVPRVLEGDLAAIERALHGHPQAAELIAACVTTKQVADRAAQAARTAEQAARQQLGRQVAATEALAAQRAALEQERHMLMQQQVNAERLAAEWRQADAVVDHCASMFNDLVHQLLQVPGGELVVQEISRQAERDCQRWGARS